MKLATASVRNPSVNESNEKVLSDLRNSTDKKKHVNFKTAARVVQMGTAPPADIVSDEVFDDPKKQIRNQANHGESIDSISNKSEKRGKSESDPVGKSKVKKKWDQTKIVDESLLVEKSSFQPLFKLGSKILFGLLLFGIVLLTTCISQIGYLILFQDLSSDCTGCLFSNKVNVTPIIPPALIPEIIDYNNRTSVDITDEKARQLAQDYTKDILQSYVASGQLCILLLPQIHMFLTGIYFFKFKHIYKKARSFSEGSFVFMLIRTIIESGLFVVFSLLVVPKLNHVTLLSIGFSQTLVPVIFRLISQIHNQKASGQKQLRNAPRKKSEMSDEFDPKDFELPKKNGFNSFLGGVFQFVLVLIALLHFVLIGYNCYVQQMDAIWIAILYVYIIWSSVKYGANYMHFKDLSTKDEEIRFGNDSWVYHFFPEPNWTKDEMVETQYMRSFVASLFHIITTIVTVFVIKSDDIFESKLTKIPAEYQVDLDFNGLDNFNESFTKFCIFYGFVIWFGKFISILAMRLKLQYTSFAFPVIISYVGIFLTYHFYEVKVTMFEIAAGSTEFYSALYITQKVGLSVFWNSPEKIEDIKMLELAGEPIPLPTYPLACFLTGFILFVFVTWHVFRDRSTMYALERHLMFNPPYEIAFQGANLMLNRRKKDERPIRDNEKGQSDPYVFICTTLWQENEQEMEVLLRSLTRLANHLERKKARVAERKNEILKNKDGEDFDDDDKARELNYDLEINIYFDNAFEKRSTAPKWNGKTWEKFDPEKHGYGIYDKDIQEWKVCNFFVKQLSDLLKKVLSGYGLEQYWEHSQAFVTPYGGKIVWNLNGTIMNIHLKDADVIKRGKRWSQIMYLYSLFGWKITDCEMTSQGKKLDPKNSYLLALDGDVDFEAEDFELVLNRMVRNSDVAACCNQIHPRGAGPLVWFQRFEYAVGHWFQKAAEHVLGCVLCSPGCFSLVRVSHLMEDNVMSMYKSLAKNARTKLMYDQGEDRWLCTLMLLTGGRIEYEAGSHCLTFAPEELGEFFKQRRRWGPSTAVNIFELISNARQATSKNKYITMSYIAYQLTFLVLQSIGVCCTMLIMWEALELGLNRTLSSEWCGVIVFAPVIAFIIVCFRCDSPTQLMWVNVLTILYSVIMVLLSVAIIVGGGNCPINLTVVFLVFMAVIHVAAALLHWDFGTLVCGIVYWIGIPSCFIFLQIYMIANINDVSWGTRSSGGGGGKDKKTLLEKVKDFYASNSRWVGVKKYLQYFWDPKVEDKYSEGGADGASVGNPEAVQATVEDIELSFDSSDDENQKEDQSFINDDFGSAAEDNDEVIEARPNGTIKKVYTDHTFISPFAVCGGTRVGSFRTAFMQDKKPKNESSDEKKRRMRRFDSAYNLDSKQKSSSGALLRTNETLKIRLMSEPGKPEASSQDDHLSSLLQKKNQEGPADLFHKSSYMKDLKQLSKGYPGQSEEVNALDLTEEEKEIFNDGIKWEHSKIYSWVNASAEKNSIISVQRPITKSDLRNRESKRYNDLMQYKKSDFEWVEKDNKLENKETKEEKKPRDYKYVIRPKPGVQKCKSSYLSWILDLERTPFSEQSRVYSLPQYEEDFWNDMLSKGNPAKNLDPGYLTLDKDVMGQEEKTKENEARMAQELTDFRNKVAFALLFINLCFFVFAVTLKAYGDELPGYVMHIPVSLLSFGSADDFQEWQKNELTIGGVSPDIFTMIDELDCANSTSADVKKLATKLLSEDDYKMKCVDYFQSLTDDCRSVELEFPYFNLLFLVGYIFLLGMQVICMIKHRFSTICHYISNISWRKFKEELAYVHTHNKELRDQIQTGKVKRNKKKSLQSAVAEMGYHMLSPSRGSMSSSNPKKQKPAPKTNPANVASKRRNLSTLQE